MFDFESTESFEWALEFCRRRCPKLTEQELEEAAYNWLNYMQVVYQIHRRMMNEKRDIESAR